MGDNLKNLNTIKNSPQLSSTRKLAHNDKMKFGSTPGSPYRQEFQKSINYQKNLNKALEYGRNKVQNKKNSVVNFSEEEKILIKTNESSAEEYFKDTHEVIKINDKVDYFKKCIIKPEHTKSMSMNSLPSKNSIHVEDQLHPKIVIKGKGFISAKNIFDLLNETKSKFNVNGIQSNKIQNENDRKSSKMQSLLKNAEYDFGLSKAVKSSFFGQVKQHIDKKNHLEKIKKINVKQKLPLNNISNNYKANSCKYSFEKQRDQNLLEALLKSMESLERVDKGINKCLNNAYEEIYNNEYKRIDDKVKKMINHQKTFEEILNNKHLDSRKKSTLLRSLFNP